MNEAPSLPAPAERVVRVIKGNEAKSEVQLKNAGELNSKARLQQNEATTLRAAESDLKLQIKSAEDIQATRGLLKKLEVGITGKGKLESKSLEDLKGKLKTRITEAETAEKQKTENESEAEKGTKIGVHAGTVAEANRRNISADSGRRSGETPKKLSEAERVARKKQAAAEFQKSSSEDQRAIKEKKRDVDWEERVVPISESDKMKQSLQEQTSHSDSLKFYDENTEGIDKYKAEPKYLMPLPLVNKLKQIIVTNEKGYYSKAGDKKINEVLIGITPLYEQIVKISEEKGVQMNEQLIIRAFTEGLNITRNFNKDSVDAFLREKTGRNIGYSDKSYLNTSVAVMNEFFANRKNIVGEARLPYILAYIAGEMVNNAPRDVMVDTRNLLAESIPVKQSSGIIEPLGFGFTVKHNTLGNMVTYDPAVLEAFAQANEITHEILDSLNERRRFDMAHKFGDSMILGGYSILHEPLLRITPELRKQEST